MNKVLKIAAVAMMLVFAVSCASTSTPVTVDGKMAKVVLVSEFEFGKADFPDKYVSDVKGLGKAIKAMDSYNKVYVTGFTDSIGGESRNMQLSKERAQVIADMLIKEGIPASKIVVAGKGAKNPVASNNSDAGRAKNRRVEVEVK